MSPLLLFVLFLILWAEFVNGWTDAPNAIATVVSTRVLSPRKAIVLATSLNTLGAFSGIAVATTIGKGIVKPEMINLQTLAGAMTGIIIWSTFAWKKGLPTSESHGLIAGLTGSALAAGGFETLESSGWNKVFIGLLFSTFLGYFSAYFLFVSIVWVFKNTPISRVRRLFGKLQIISAAFMAYSHGSNDGQKFIGTFALALLLGGVTTEFSVPAWVIILCALTMGVGTSVGGWRIIKTLGVKLAKLEPQHGFAAETAAAASIELATRFGIPLSTTHTISTAIMGVGSAQRLNKVRWSVASNIITGWVLTFPICGLIAWVTTKVLLALGI
ncbi:MAG: Phosphate transporter [Candidatus Woesebacteria bacterium GW2011_GWB1_38_5b]|uniref:Phosphate transporter n=1 Tax=Candidatus Woesebacteria bacterium GW2011_GWB1_38_5b TaxID=1618569 RepID=A0A0G0NBE6_9BACT|nr:MAG: Phosphate transporter [Candidatus Woesebacteria bacterium GW2011_GWB1_38_5b]